MNVPQTLLDDLKYLPVDRPVTLLMRHSARYPIHDIATGDSVGLTPEGVRMAEDFGRQLARVRKPGRILTSRVGRCVDTASAIVRGAGWNNLVNIHPYLWHPYMSAAWDEIDRCAPCLAVPQVVQDLLDLSTPNGSPAGTLDILVTHDSTLACVIHYVLGLPFRGEPHWPNFLEGLYFWKEGGDTVITWRSQTFVLAGSLA